MPIRKEAEANRASREKTVTWLSKAKPTNSAQATSLWLLLDVRTSKPAEQLKARIDQLLKLQNADGGWSQTKDVASDAFATGQALYSLSFAGVKNDRPEIQRAITFLTSTQRDDGSWPMTPRNHPEVDATKKRVRWSVPITYFGSAWAVLGLVRYVPSPPDTPTKQRHAFDTLQPTALVHEAYLRLVGNSAASQWNGRGHFFAAAAEAMRRILVEDARQKHSLKRGGDRVRLEMDRLEATPQRPDECLALHEALKKLAMIDP